MRRLILTAGVLALAGCAAPGPERVVVVQQAPVARGCDTRFQVVNQSSFTVNAFHFGPSSQASWGPDQLGTSVLPPGASVSFRAANIGNYDFRAVWAGGRAADIMRIDVCRMNRITVTNGGLRAT